MEKLLKMKLCIILLFALFISLVALGQIYTSQPLTISGLMCFTAAAALMTYYMVLTQP
jgi:hypothetical protein